MQQDGPKHHFSNFPACLYISPNDKCLIAACKQGLKVTNSFVSMVTPFIGINNFIIPFILEAIIKGDIGIYHIGPGVTRCPASNGTKIIDLGSRFQGQIKILMGK